jgi:hypothetical protein
MKADDLLEATRLYLCLIKHGGRCSDGTFLINGLATKTPFLYIKKTSGLLGLLNCGHGLS